MPTLFYHRYWDVVGNDVTDMALETLNHGTMFKKFGYILLAYEVHHAIKKKRGGLNGWFSLKLDMEKAYNQVEWVFLNQIMLKVGIPGKLVPLIMDLVSGVTYSALVNGEQCGYIVPSRGLRQKDPLSPYLFILYTEELIALINTAVAKGDWKDIKVNIKGPVVSHLLFTDDALLFAWASVEECMVVKGMLQLYENTSGQRVNYHKSAIAFSLNVGEELKRDICEVFGVAEVSSHAKYLGLPTVAGKSKVELFDSITDRVQSKVEEWQPKLLSRAGNEVLIKAVAQPIPCYAMQCFRFLAMFCDDLEAIMGRFWWGSSNGEKV
ncbi:hypothetical protein LIER_07795 [Lithospermum erythrorhizon]|uniref:Reverse transcriptase domain-containing protein n=1 Tax=Lithospermum erythrorhizon TaxID=34254 RepID=A0AAV3PAV5_LITER